MDQDLVTLIGGTICVGMISYFFISQRSFAKEMMKYSLDWISHLFEKAQEYVDEGDFESGINYYNFLLSSPPCVSGRFVCYREYSEMLRRINQLKWIARGRLRKLEKTLPNIDNNFDDAS